MEIKKQIEQDGSVSIIAGSIPSEDVLVRSKSGYIPQYLTDVYGQTRRVAKDVTLLKLIKSCLKEFPDYQLVSLGTPVNFEIAPTHLTRVDMNFEDQEQTDKCLKEIKASDMMIRLRVQPAWTWELIMQKDRNVILHVGWYDTVYFLQFKDVFLGDLHCRYSAKFGFNPNDAKITHFRYDEHGDLEVLGSLNESEREAETIKNDVEFLRVFRDGTIERT